MPVKKEKRNARDDGTRTRTSTSCALTVRPSSGNGSSCGDGALSSGAVTALVELRIPAARGQRPSAPNVCWCNCFSTSGAGWSQRAPRALRRVLHYAELGGPTAGAAEAESHTQQGESRSFLLERHATPADGGQCREFPRPSDVKQPRRAKTKGPTCRAAQVGRVVSPLRGGALAMECDLLPRSLHR